jgi:hypothetical protein
VVSQTFVPLVNTVRTVSIRRPIGDAAETRIVTASLGTPPAPETPYASSPSAAPALPDAVVASAPAEHPTLTTPRSTGAMNEVDYYLWSVYRRSPTKRDRSGDFSWKDPAAAEHAGLTLQAYVIMGMDRDLRELIYHAGKAMDAAGIPWTIVSGFRDDYRQSIAAGLKARTGYSRHGGSKATGGYGHGLAIDVGHVDSENSNVVFAWIDANGARYGLARPIRRFDPPHVEPRGDWRQIAADLRRERTGAAVAQLTPDTVTPSHTRAALAGAVTQRSRAGRARLASRSLRGRRR